MRKLLIMVAFMAACGNSGDKNMAVIKPTEFTEVAIATTGTLPSGAPKKVRPPVAVRNEGYTENFEYPNNHHNWLFDNVYQWETWLEASLARSASVVVAASAGLVLETQADLTSTGSADQSEINAAIAVVDAAGGGVVQLSEGIFTVDATIGLLSSVLLRGSGPGTIIQVAAGATSDFNILSATLESRIVVENLVLDGNSAGGHGHFHTGIFLSSVNDSQVRNVIVRNCDQSGTPTYGHGVHLAGASFQNRVTGCEFTSLEGLGVYEEASGSENSITNNMVNLCGGGASLLSGGIVMVGDRGLVIGNVLNANITTGIGVAGDHANVIGNIVNNQTGIGLAATAGEHVIVTGNRVLNSTSDGMQLASNFSVMSNNMVDTTGSNGIYVAGSDNSLVQGNHVRFADNHGIYVDTCSETVIGENLVSESSRSGDDNASHIYIEGGTLSVVRGNVTHGTGGVPPQADHSIEMDAVSIPSKLVITLNRVDLTASNNAPISTSGAAGTEYRTIPEILPDATTADTSASPVSISSDTVANANDIR